MTYLEECNKYFQPLDEISEAIENGEGISGLSNKELLIYCCDNEDLANDLYEIYGTEVADYI